ncbi:DUF1064 domain-containing protein [Halalkalibacterium ligniniphilum]|uniref:DUF1064 domain-containing protein n=1 Tax=Halalkalibacterium ligniniphilum TaxID=1134413 RepID=UPI00036E6D6F|nr:DUF1064 domain-containing protein [Halalkalibacterium ligniniphilum]
MGKVKIPSKRTTYYGITFDSAAEAEFYLMLRADKTVKEIECQPQYTLLDPFEVACIACAGQGKAVSEKTGRLIKCRRCNGSGKKGRQPWTYKPDFKVTYHDGRIEVIDVKGGFVNENFRLVKKMFEYTTGQELVVWKKTKKGWKKG